MIKTKLTAIAAMTPDGIIGVNNRLPWHCKEDLQFFKSQTINNTCIFGRKTFESLGGLLPQRNLIIISNDKKLSEKAPELYNETDIVSSYAELEILLKTKKYRDQKHFICGGAAIYKSLLPYCSDLFLTIIKKECDGGDKYFPVNLLENFKEKEVIKDNKDLKISYFVKA